MYRVDRLFWDEKVCFIINSGGYKVYNVEDIELFNLFFLGMRNRINKWGKKKVIHFSVYRENFFFQF